MDNAGESELVAGRDGDVQPPGSAPPMSGPGGTQFDNQPAPRAHLGRWIPDKSAVEVPGAGEGDRAGYLEAMLAASHDGIAVVEAEGKFELVNPAFCRILGWQEDELLGQHFLKVIPEDLREFILQRWQEVRAGQGRPYEVDVVGKDGVRRHLLVSHRHTEVSGRRKYCAVAHDITERRQAEDALHETKDRLEHRVRERTRALAEANRELQDEIAERKQIENALQEKNIALRELLVAVQDEKAKIGRQVLGNVDKIVLPILRDLVEGLPAEHRRKAELLQQALEDITSPFTDRLSRRFADLTPAEIRICNQIRQGLVNKEIAAAEHVSRATINKHREHIRRKLELTHSQVNLASYLKNFMSGPDQPEEQVPAQ